MNEPLERHPDRLFPRDPATRAVARRLHAEVAGAPILSPHSHVEAGMLLRDEPFPDPAALLITPDHYVTRLLHAHGIPLDDLGLRRDGMPPTTTGREVWRQLSRLWHVFLGTPVRYWLEDQLLEVFGIDEQPSAENADKIYDQLSETLAGEDFRPRKLFDRFGIEVLATTDDPADDLSAHLALRKDPEFHGRVLPTFRADRYMDPSAPAWPRALTELTEMAGIDCTTHSGLLEALRVRRKAFRDAGGTATDTGVLSAASLPLSAAERERLHADGLRGDLTTAGADAYRADMLYRFAEMAAEDGMVMQLHAGVHRGTHEPTKRHFGPDTGHDLPAVGGYTLPLSHILNDFGTAEKFRIVLFTVDEAIFSREIAPLAGFYPSVYAGAPWWFLDSPAGITRYRAAVTDSAGFAKTSGFIDDTRAFCSIPARHDMSRRIDAAWLAELVAGHQMTEDDAVQIARNLVDGLPRGVFRL